MRVRRIGEGIGIDLFSGDQIAGLSQRGKFTRSAGYGFATCGLAKFGDSLKIGGIYQRRRAGYNQHTGPPPPNSETYFVKMRSYAPTNPQTVEQQSNRDKFKDGILTWQALTLEQKSAYNKRASRQGRVGYFLFMSEYMKTH